MKIIKAKFIKLRKNKLQLNSSNLVLYYLLNVQTSKFFRLVLKHSIPKECLKKNHSKRLKSFFQIKLILIIICNFKIVLAALKIITIRSKFKIPKIQRQFQTFLNILLKLKKSKYRLNNINLLRVRKKAIRYGWKLWQTCLQEEMHSNNLQTCLMN